MKFGIVDPYMKFLGEFNFGTYGSSTFPALQEVESKLF